MGPEQMGGYCQGSGEWEGICWVSGEWEEIVGESGEWEMCCVSGESGKLRWL